MKETQFVCDACLAGAPDWMCVCDDDRAVEAAQAGRNAKHQDRGAGLGPKDEHAVGEASADAPNPAPSIKAPPMKDKPMVTDADGLDVIEALVADASAIEGVANVHEGSSYYAERLIRRAIEQGNLTVTGPANHPAMEAARPLADGDMVERVRQQIKAAELAMIEERKAQYGSAFRAEQRIAIERMHRQQLTGANLMAEALAPLLQHKEEAERERGCPDPWHKVEGIDPDTCPKCGMKV